MIPLVFSLALVGVAFAGPADDPNEPPVVGQPDGFAGAVGSYKVAASARPTDVQAEDPVTFTVRVTGHGPAGHQPRRPDLRRQSAFGKRFAVEDLPEDKTAAAAGVWEFRYRLRPLNVEVREIPALRFVYFKPGIIPREKGYRTTYADAIPLTVRPRAEVGPGDVQGPGKVSRYPKGVYELREGADEVLRKDEPFTLPGWFALFLLAAGPPVVCGAVYYFTARRNPVALRRARQRRSRAADKALAYLTDQYNWKDLDRHMHKIASRTAEYLRERWDLKGGEPTPAEVADHFRKAGNPMAEQIAAFFRTCDVARFAPAPGDARHLLNMAREMIFALEEQS